MKILFLLLLAGSTAFAQSSAHYAITRSVVADGGAALNGTSRFQLTGTVAQPLAATPAGTRFSIQGGFWIQPAPIFFAPTQVEPNFLVSIQSELGKTYTVQYMNVLGSSWQNLTSVAGNGNIITVTNAALGVTQRFFRLMQQ